MRTLITAALAAFILSACAGAVPWNPQGNAGIETFEMGFRKGQGEFQAEPKYVRFVSGKESSTSQIYIEIYDKGLITIDATGTAAFEGQRIRGQVETEVSEDAANIAPGIVDSAIDAVTGGLP